MVKIFIKSKNVHVKQVNNSYAEGVCSKHISLKKGRKEEYELPITLIRNKVYECYYEALGTTRGELVHGLVNINENNLEMRRTIFALVREIGGRLLVNFDIFFNDCPCECSSMQVNFITHGRAEELMIFKELTGRYVYLLYKSRECYENNPSYVIPFEEYLKIVKSKGIEGIHILKNQSIKEGIEEIISDRSYSFIHEMNSGIHMEREFETLDGFLLVTPYKIKETIGELYNIKEIGMILRK